ncbi:MAG TPA: YncE family protein [Bacteroidales bacterium]|nr:YncE family protein [Bacteroidales bacterium]
MKQIRYILLVFLALLCFSCNDMADVEREIKLPEHQATGKILVLSEGLFNMNNSTLAYYDFSKKELITDYFLQKNSRGLGDTANDMILYGSKIYIAVNVSSQIEVIDANTGLSVKRIPVFDENKRARQPRYLTQKDGKVYLSCFDGNLLRIDTLSLEIDGMVKCGRNPEGLCIANEKIYVANSGGLDNPNYDNTVSVVDIKTFKELKKIKVADNPYKVFADSQGDVYVSSRGNYSTSQPYRFQRIDSYIDEVIQDFEGLNVLNFTVHNDIIYMYSFDFNSDDNWIKTFDCLTEKVISENFITDDTKVEKPYSIQVNPYDGNIYITNTSDFTMTGDVLCFNPDGKLQFTINNIGLNSNKIIFLK